jgi:hypothetical protein
VLTILLILAWKTAGWYGLDRWLLPLIGTPWQPGEVLRRTRQSPVPITGPESGERNVMERDTIERPLPPDEPDMDIDRRT